MSTAPSRQQRTRRFERLEIGVAGSGVALAVSGYLLHLAVLDFGAALLAVASLSLLGARRLLGS